MRVRQHFGPECQLITRLSIRSLAIAIAVLVANRGASAQSPASLGIAAGASVPVGGYGSDKNVGYHIGLLLDIRTPTPMVGVRIDGAFHEIGFTGNSTKEDIWTINGNAMLKVPTGRMVVPYAIGGAGFYNSHRNLFFGSRSSTGVGVNGGAGLRFELSDVTTFVEARYHMVSGDAKIRILPITLGILF
jgi:opacity protein-like surface antigen